MGCEYVTVNRQMALRICYIKHQLLVELCYLNLGNGKIRYINILWLSDNRLINFLIEFILDLYKLSRITSKK